jgi:hypothetical protein
VSPETETALDRLGFGEGGDAVADRGRIDRREKLTTRQSRDLVEHIVTGRFADALEGRALDRNGGFEGGAVFRAGHREPVFAGFAGSESAGE